MKAIKLSGRERTVIREIDAVSGSTGAELLEKTNLEESDLLGVLTGLITVGLFEAFNEGDSNAVMDDVPLDRLRATRFEVNPAYAQQIREWMRRS